MSGPTRNLRVTDHPANLVYAKAVKLKETEGDQSISFPIKANTYVRAFLIVTTAYTDTGTATVTAGDDDDADEFFGADNLKAVAITEGDNAFFYDEANNLTVTTALQNDDGSAGEALVVFQMFRLNNQDMVTQ